MGRLNLDAPKAQTGNWRPRYKIPILASGRELNRIGRLRKSGEYCILEVRRLKRQMREIDIQR